VLNLVGFADRRLRAMVLIGAALMVVPVLFAHVAWLVGYFHISYATAFVIISLIIEGSPWLFWVFPWIIPVEVTVEVLIAVFGVAVAAGW
jgi:hypothetical protein